jgi:hypothetical protein
VANERLREALNAVGLTPQDLAGDLDVDPKTAERWITLGRIPYRKHRHRISAIVREREGYLWPDALTEAQRDRIAASEIVQLYPRRSGVSADLWAQLFGRAAAYLDVLAYAGLFLPEQHPELVTSLCEKAESGARLRLLLGDPTSEAVAVRGREEGIGDSVAAKIHNVMSFYRPHSDHGCVEVRFHATTLYTSIYRFDDEMLVNMHVLGRPAAQAPTMHIRRLSAGDLFDTYAETYERVWAGAKGWDDLTEGAS